MKYPPMGAAGKSVRRLRQLQTLALGVLSYKIAMRPRPPRPAFQGSISTMANTGKSKRPMLGAHMSIAGEVGAALIRGQQVGCDCIQIFTKSSRQWAAKAYTKEEIEKFKRNQVETGIKTVIAHDSYLVNLGAPDKAMRLKSVKEFIDELHRCEALGVPILVAHAGAHVGSGIRNGMKTIAKSIDEAHAASKGFEVKIALESTARQGTHIRRKVERVA